MSSFVAGSARTPLYINTFGRRISAMISKLNLIYHLTPTGNFRWNLEQICRRIEVFNGKRIFAIARGEGLEPLSAFSELLPERATIVSYPNDPELRESATLLPLLEHVKSTDPTEATFYAHSKGVSYVNSPGVRRWTELMHEHNLDRIEDVKEALETHPCCGVFRRFGHLANMPCDWYYSGAFWWVRNDALFSKLWRKVPLGRYTTEAYLSFFFSKDAGACLHVDNAPHLYWVKDIDSIGKPKETAETVYRDKHVVIVGGGPDVDLSIPMDTLVSINGHHGLDCDVVYWTKEEYIPSAPAKIAFLEEATFYAFASWVLLERDKVAFDHFKVIAGHKEPNGNYHCFFQCGEVNLVFPFFPLTGVLAIYHALACGAASVYVTGFDFYGGSVEWRNNHYLPPQLGALRHLVRTEPRFKPDAKLRELLTAEMPMQAAG